MKRHNKIRLAAVLLFLVIFAAVGGAFSMPHRMFPQVGDVAVYSVDDATDPYLYAVGVQITNVTTQPVQVGNTLREEMRLVYFNFTAFRENVTLTYMAYQNVTDGARYLKGQQVVTSRNITLSGKSGFLDNQVVNATVPIISYRFPALAGQNYTIEADNQSVSMDAKAALYDPSGEAVLMNYGYSGYGYTGYSTVPSRIIWTCPVSGNYTIVFQNSFTPILIEPQTFRMVFQIDNESTKAPIKISDNRVITRTFNVWNMPSSSEFPYPSYLFAQPRMNAQDIALPVYGVPVISTGVQVFAGNLHNIEVTRVIGNSWVEYWTWDRDTGFLLMHEFKYATAAGVTERLTYTLAGSNLWPFSTFWYTALLTYLTLTNWYFILGVVGWCGSYIGFQMYDRRKRKIPVFGENKQYVLFGIMFLCVMLAMIVVQYYITQYMYGSGGL
jgi:hypothetical protein